ncbi:glutaredoxin [Arthroderma uncinatum]|uniref:glutaredoxin n=1 Tax=Arthroderma uncinatum TaxID=74035 RepID=UPI00144ADE1B|nr:glutaredoxin [Arthroderma uncinatum]KAF3491719.1 glutaredoxin [Arthroderma uncinatum]
MSAAKVKAEQIIADNGVVVFSKSYCPHCNETKALLNSQGAKYFTMELDKVGKEKWETDVLEMVDDGPAIQDALQQLTKQRTVPNIFINHQHIGGNSDLMARSSQLPQLLKDAGAL